ncbi:unnamed protein product [Coffea canephora]|uniref:Uncharacterized protein n=1 Tax=Coffea canephora TaxID=49390 RepID=A0A068UQL8_COFCA|nr:unnamed protein product [Coffea canephora]
MICKTRSNHSPSLINSQPTFTSIYKDRLGKLGIDYRHKADDVNDGTRAIREFRTTGPYLIRRLASSLPSLHGQFKSFLTSFGTVVPAAGGPTKWVEYYVDQLGYLRASYDQQY